MLFTTSDRVWGLIGVNDPCLAELIRSAPLQRLRGIRQAGASSYLLGDMRPITRFEHSLGVMHLLSLLGASREEQVAGLLHDVPHTAFSHTTDIVFPNSEHNYHERHHLRLIMSSEIPEIIGKFGLPQTTYTSSHHFALLEQPLPRLCADRIDYTLRDMAVLGEANPQQAVEFAHSLRSDPEGIVVTSVEAALWFSRLFTMANDRLYTGIADAGAYWALAGAIKRAISIGAFTEADLFLTDDGAMEILSATPDPIVRAYLSLLRPGTVFYAVNAESGKRAFLTHMKQRVVDPLVQTHDMKSALPLSDILPAYKAHIQNQPPNGSVQFRLWTDSMPPLLAALLADEG